MGCVVRVPRSLAARHRIAVGALCHQSMRVFCGAADGSRGCTGGWEPDVHSIKRPYTRHLFSRCTPCFARLCCFFFFFCTRPRTSAEWPLCIRIDLTNALSLSQVFLIAILRYYPLNLSCSARSSKFVTLGRHSLPFLLIERVSYFCNGMKNEFELAF